MFWRDIVVLAVAAAPVVAASAPDTVSMPPYRVDAGGFADSERDIRAVCDSAGLEMWRYFPDHRIEPFVVVRGHGEPITLFERNPRREIVIQLDTGDRLWCQYAYQFTHEFCHVLCGFKPGDSSNQWFEETLCELASLYAIRGMARSWRTNPPYPHWRDYGDALRDYADQAMSRRSHAGEIARIGLAAFFTRHEAALRSLPLDRDLTGSIAVVLLDSFEKRPQHWGAVRWLNARKTETVRSFDTYLADWMETVPDEHRPFVVEIAGLFGRTIERPVNRD